VKKNTYESADVTYHGGEEFGSDIHNVAIRTNHIVWDMIKILDKNMLFGFHFQTKLSTHKIIIVMIHEDHEMLEKAKKLLHDFHDLPNVLFLPKLKKKKNNIKILKILTALILLGLFLFGIYQLILYLYKNNKFHFQPQDKQIKTIKSNEDNITVVKIDIQKLKAIKETFDQENTPIQPKVMKAMDITTAIISDIVPPSQKAKYSSQKLVKNFKGKGGIRLEIDNSNQNKEFNNTLKELNSYTKNFIKSKDIEAKIKSYDKILKSNRPIKDEEKADILSNKANLEKIKGNLKSSKKEYIKSLEITNNLAQKNPYKYSAKEGFILSQLSKVESDLNLTKRAKEHLDKAEIKYKKSLDIIKQSYSSNPKKYAQDLAWAYNINASFYDNEKNDFNKSINLKLEALSLYKKLYKENPKKFTILLFKTINSLAKTYIKDGNIRDAKLYYQYGLNIISKTKYKRYIALSHHNLGFIYTKENEFKKALKEYNSAKKIYKSDKNSTIETINIDYAIASMYSYQKKFEIAIEGYKKVIREYKKLNKKNIFNSKIAKAQNKIAWIYISQPKFKNYKKAKNILKDSIKLTEKKEEDKEILSQSYSYLAHLELLNNHIDKSIIYYKYSLFINHNFNTAMRYNLLLISQNKFLKAFKNFELMLKRYKGKEQQAKILMEYGKFYITINEEIAKEKLKESLNLYNKLSQINKKKYKEIDFIYQKLEIKKG